MEFSYLDRYKTVQTYKENKFQKLLIGADSENNEAVIINNFFIDKNNYAWDLDEYEYKNIFDNVIHFEKTDKEAVIVMCMREGSSLNEYLTDINPSFVERVNLIYKYLNGIKKYDSLPNNIKSILVEEPQVVVTEGQIFFDELIIFDENNFNIKDFEKVKSNILSVLKNLTSLPHIDYNDLPLYIEVVGFIDELRKDYETYNSIEAIVSNFEKLNVNSLLTLSRQVEQPLHSNVNLTNKTLSSINKDPILEMHTSKNYPLTILIAIAGIVTTALVAMFVFKSILPLNKDLNNNVNASSNITDLNNLTDNDNDENSTSIDNYETVNPNDNAIHLSEHIEKDFTTSKYGDYSFKISNDGSNFNDNNLHNIKINKGAIEAGSQFLMWIKSNTNDEVNITVEGYSGGNLSFKKSMFHKPLHIGSWELVQFTLGSGIDDFINIIFNNVKGTIWIDKISIDMFK